MIAPLVAALSVAACSAFVQEQSEREEPTGSIQCSFRAPYQYAVGFDLQLELLSEATAGHPVRRYVRTTHAEFSSLPKGSYRLRLFDPRFEPWEKGGLQTGTTVEIPLVGRARLALRLIDARTKHEIHNVWVELRMFDEARDREPYATPTTIHLRSGDSNAVLPSIHEHVFSGDASIITRIPGYGWLPERRIGYLETGVLNERTIELEPAASISGLVFDGDTPVRATSVLVRTRASRDLARGGYTGMPWWSWPIDGLDVPPWTYQLTEVQPGPLWVEAFVGPNWSTRSAIELLPGEARNLNLALPRPARVEGRLIDSRQRHFGELLIVVLRDMNESNRWTGWFERHDVDENGRFSLGPWNPGVYEVRLALYREPESPLSPFGPWSQVPSFLQAYEFSLGSVNVWEGAQRSVAYDLDSMALSRLELRLRGGFVCPGRVAVLRERCDGRPPRHLSSLIVEEGRATFEFVPSGDWTYCDYHNGWLNASCDVPAFVADGTTHSFELKLAAPPPPARVRR